jgi:hypothetical protein
MYQTDVQIRVVMNSDSVNNESSYKNNNHGDRIPWKSPIHAKSSEYIRFPSYHEFIPSSEKDARISWN